MLMLGSERESKALLAFIRLSRYGSGHGQVVQMNIRKRGEKTKYDFVDAGCLGRSCFAPGMFQHRGATASGSRNTGSPDTPCCLNRAYRGCPNGPVGEMKTMCDNCDNDSVGLCPYCGGSRVVTVAGLPVVDPGLRKKRHAEGWKAAK